MKISRLVEVGNLSKGELLQIRAQAASERLNIAMDENLLKMSVLDLAQLLDLDSAVNFRIEHPNDLSVEKLGVPGTVEEIFTQAISFLPQIKSSGYNVKIAEKYLALQKGQRMPSVNLGGLYYTRYLKGAANPLNPGIDYVYRDQLSNNQYSQLSVGLEIPLFNRMVVHTNIAKARIQLRDSQYALDQDIQNLFKNIQQVHGNAFSALEKYRAAREAVISNEESFRYTQQKLEAGLVNSVDYNIAKANLLKANSDLLQAKYEFIFRMKIIDFYTGKEIFL
jgi:outer membrane protein